VPVKLEDRFGNLKEGSEEEKQQRPSLAIKPDQNEWEEPLDERASMLLPSSLQLARERRARRLGRYGLAAEALSMRPDPCQRPQPYSLSLLAAISQQAVVGAQVIEGGVDASVFENFLHQVLRGLRARGAFEGPGVVLLLDNARIHHHSRVVAQARAEGAHILFNAQYSPWLNPVETLFGHLKRRIKREQAATR
jgi:hypothetical protein